MFYVIVLVAGVIAGAVLALAYLWDWRDKVQRQAREAESKSRQAQASINTSMAREAELAGLVRDTKAWQAQRPTRLPGRTPRPPRNTVG